MKLMRLFDCERVISRTPSRFIHLIFHSVVFLLSFSRSLRAFHKSVLRKSPQPLIKLELSLVFVSIFILEIQILLSFDIEKEKALDVIGPFLDNIIMHNIVSYRKISWQWKKQSQKTSQNTNKDKCFDKLSLGSNIRTAYFWIVEYYVVVVSTWKNVKKREN